MSTEADRHTSADKAITQVLSAEQSALSQIAACESRANRILRDARKAVRAMVRRAQQRISRVHAGCSARTRELVDQMEREAEVDTRRSKPGDPAQDMLLSVVRSVARELTEPGRTDVD